MSTKILINALSARQRGGQTYLKNVLRHLPKDGSIRVLLLAPASLELGFEHAYVETRTAASWLENPFLRAGWERFALPRLARQYGAHIVFCPGGVVTGAPAECRVVTMFRNMIPFDLEQRRRYPLGYERFRNWLLYRVLLRSMVEADLVIFVSDYARKVVERHAGNRPLRAVVIPHGIPNQFRNPSGDMEARQSVFQGPYLLYVSYLDFYKAQIEVVRAYASLRKERPTREKLILVGPENPAYGALVRAEIASLSLEEHVVVTGPLPYESLPHLYQGATVNIFASEAENCPNTLLEALASGRPVVCSDRAPMPEFAGDGALYFDPRSPDDLAAKLRELLDNPEAMKALAERARARSRLYDWERAARRTWDVMVDVATAAEARLRPA